MKVKLFPEKVCESIWKPLTIRKRLYLSKIVFKRMSFLVKRNRRSLHTIILRGILPKEGNYRTVAITIKIKALLCEPAAIPSEIEALLIGMN
jgi:hypothetical protein